MRRILGLLLLSSLFGCGDDDVPGVCTSSNDCASTEQCLDNMCVASIDAGAADVVSPDGNTPDSSADAGPPEGFGDRCGEAAPCPSGLRCVEGTCHLDCGASPHCGTPELCCADGEACGAAGCAPPGDVCDPTPQCGGLESAEACPDGSYCDALVSRCLPSPDDAACTIPPSESTFEPELVWEWQGSSEYPSYRGVLVTPIVADVNHDGASDVLVIAYEDAPAAFGGSIPGFGILCALSGAGDCEGGSREIFCTDPADTTHLLNSWGHLAVADLDATDGVNELTIIAGLHNGASGGEGLVAYSETGEFLWEAQTPAGARSDVFMYGGAVTIADLNGDGRAEIIVGGSVFDPDGNQVWNSATRHAGNAGFGPISVAINLDAMPGDLEVVTGNTAYEADGTLRWSASAIIGDGYAAVADFNGDDSPEIVVVSAGSVAVLAADGTAFAPTLALNTLRVEGAAVSGRGGAPTISDIDGDGRPEIGLATANAYVTLRVTAEALIEAAWVVPVNDASSNITASAMFDFDGNGITEVVYQDTCRTRVFSGIDGAILFEVPNSSGTASNYPTVADLNGDGRAEFILVADSYYARAFPGSALGCPAGTPLIDGVRVFRDANDSWQSTRAIWNQHSYHVTNVCDGADAACSDEENQHGAIPRRETNSWDARLGGYRVNTRFGADDQPAPDLVPLSVAADLSTCPAGLTIRVDVANRGARSVSAGTPVSFYEGDPDGENTLLGTVELTRALAPGGVERVELRIERDFDEAGSIDVFVIVNNDGMGPGRDRECLSENNTSAVLSAQCVGLL